MNVIMHAKRKFTTIVSAAAFVLTLFLPAAALAYDAPPVARLSEVLDEALVLGKDDVEWSYAEPNLIVEEGDLLQTNETGMVETQFEGDVVFRIGERTRVAAIEIGEETVIGMDNGRAYLRIARDFSQAEAFIVTFQSGQVAAIGKTLTRIDVFEDGSAEVKVIRGAVDLVTISEEPTLVQAGERVSINSGGYTEFSGLDMARADNFDAWNEERDIALSTYRRSSYVDESLVGAEDLEGYGEWVYADGFDSYAWQPYVVDGWSPYSYGRWYYSNNFGWTWIPEEPWGYATYHYGSWNYDPYYGWIWIPGTTWRPAYVHWVGYDDYIGWAPIGYHGYPVITTYPYHVTNIYTSYVDVYSFTFVRIIDFDHRHHHRKHHRRHGDDHRKFGDKDRRHGDGHRKFGDKDRRHFGDDPRFGKIDKKIPVTPGRRPEIIEKLKANPGKLRVIKNIENEKLQRRRRKGSVERERLAFAELVDVDKNPKLRERVAKLKQARNQLEGQRGGSVSPNLPKRAEKDRVKALDFRTRAKKFTNARPNVRSPERVRRGSVEWKGKVHTVNKRVEKQDNTVRRSSENTRKAFTRPERLKVTPEKKVQVPERLQQRREVERPEQVRTEMKQRQIERLRTLRSNRATHVENGRAQRQNINSLYERRVQSSEQMRREIPRVNRIANTRTRTEPVLQRDVRQVETTPSRVETRPVARPAQFERANVQQRFERQAAPQFERRFSPPAQRQNISGQAGRAGGPELNVPRRGSADSFVRTQPRYNNSGRRAVNTFRGIRGRRR